MVGFHLGWFRVLEKTGSMLELIEVYRGMGTCRQGQAEEVDPCLGMYFLNCDDKIANWM